MSADCVNDSYECLVSIYDRFVAVRQLRNKPRTDKLGSVLTQAETLIYLAIIADEAGDATAVAAHCESLDQLLNNV